jgi:hypothetical protein
MRTAVVMIAAVGWLALSNHCALAGIEHVAAKAHMSCHGSADSDHSPAKDKQSGTECCKVVRATLLTPEKNIASVGQLLFTAYKYVVAIVVLPDAGEQNGTFEWDTGPPGSVSFSESVLQRSLLAHAPPSLV